MNTRHVFEFTKIVSCESFTAAANELYISQSTLSKHIQALEDNLEVKLFERNTRRVKLTAAGTAFLPFALTLCDSERKFIDSLKEYKKVSTLRIGSLPIMALYGIISNVSVFEIHNPNTNVNIEEYTGDSIVKALKNGDFELIFCDESLTMDDSDLETLSYRSDHLVAAINKSHPLSDLETIDLRLLENDKLLFYGKTSPTYSLAYDLCLSVGFKPNIYFCGSRLENLTELVSLNTGIALLMSRCTLPNKMQNVVVRDLSPTTLRKIGLTRVKSKKLSTDGKAFWSFIESLDEI